MSDRISQFATVEFAMGPAKAFVYQNPWGIFIAQVPENVSEDFMSHRAWEKLAQRKIAEGECLATTYLVRATPSWEEEYGGKDRRG